MKYTEYSVVWEDGIERTTDNLSEIEEEEEENE